MKVKLTREMFIRAADECKQLNACPWYAQRDRLNLSCTSPYSCDVLSYVVAQEVGIPKMYNYRDTQKVRERYTELMAPYDARPRDFWLDSESDSEQLALRPMLLLFAGEILDGTEIEL